MDTAPHLQDSIAPGSHGWLNRVKHQFEEHGFFKLPNMLDPKQVEAMHGTVTAWLTRAVLRKGAGEAVRALSNAYGPKNGGWVVHNFPAEPDLHHLQAEFASRTMLNDALTAIFDGPERYRMLTRKDLYIDYSTTWHRDVLWGPYLKYADEQKLPLCPEVRLRDGDTPRIVTLAVYLQDHLSPKDHVGLWVRPGSHVGLSEWKQKLASGKAKNETAVYVRRGDVVVFDTLLFHRGRNTTYNPGHSMRLPHRHMFTIQYGAWPSVFSDTQARGFALRDHVFNNRSLCPRPTAVCANQLIEADLHDHPIDSLERRLSDIKSTWPCPGSSIAYSNYSVGSDYFMHSS